MKMQILMLVLLVLQVPCAMANETIVIGNKVYSLKTDSAKDGSRDPAPALISSDADPGAQVRSVNNSDKIPAYIALGMDKGLINTASYFVDNRRSTAAREEAEKRLREEMNRTGANHGINVVTADAPLPDTTVPDQAISRGDQWIRTYSSGAPKVSDDLMELQREILHSKPEIRARDDLDGPEVLIDKFSRDGGWVTVDDVVSARAGKKYMQAVIVADRLPNGKIETRLMGQDDILKYKTYEAEKDAAEARQRSIEAKADAERKRLEAIEAQDKAAEAQAAAADQKARDDAIKSADSARKKAEEAEAKRKKAEEEEQTKKKNAEEQRRLMNERDAACRLGGAGCAHADDRLTRHFEQRERYDRTAHCMLFDEGKAAPAGGPCAASAPRCIFCKKVDILNKERLMSQAIQQRLGIKVLGQ